ncbi:MAG: VTT domain-containing protein [Nocardioides sp.]|nr:VTT domain-containing protein [Nocardioides sp.]
MPDWPVVPLYLFLVVVAFLRGGATYLVGRGARGAADRAWRTDADWVRTGESVVRRFGAPAVSLCFLTIGVQSAVLLAAGTLRMPLGRFLPALLVGALLWAGVYTTVGFAVVEAIWGSGRIWLVAAVVALVAALVWGIQQVLTRRRA